MDDAQESKLKVYLKDHSFIEFKRLEESCAQIIARFENAVEKNVFFVVICNNGNFYINPHEVVILDCVPKDQDYKEEKNG